VPGQLGDQLRVFAATSSDATAEESESLLGMVRQVEVVLEPGKPACPPPSSAGAWSGDQLSLGCAGAEA
jgi:hypothetical protein